MRRATAFHRGSTATLVFQAVWFLVGVAALSQGGVGTQSGAMPGARGSYRLLVVFGFLALATSATCGMRGKAFCFVGGFTGAVLGLYGAALILLGHEDVGGLRVALPFGLGATALGLWTLMLVRGRAREGLADVA